MELSIAKAVKTKVMDHHGLVAGVSRDLGIAEKINRRIGSKDPRRKVQPGLATVAMIVNGLGFTNRRLYLTPQFFESKGISFLFKEEVSSEDFDDHTLGKCLDEISEYGASRLYGEIAFEIAMERGLMGTQGHLDSTSFSLHGEYGTDEGSETIEVTHGYSKDYRPDLKQVMMSLTMSGPANLPIWMEPLDGNSSDKKSFHETISRVRQFQKELGACEDFSWIADSALYTGEKLLACKEVYWISRVPENINECKQLISIPIDQTGWEKGPKGYAWTEVRSTYGGVEQRWLLVFSEQAYEREKKTLFSKVEKEELACSKDCWHLGAQVLGCMKDAEKQIQQLQKKYRFHRIEYSLEPIERYAVRGRPNPSTPKELQGYKVHCSISRNNDVIESSLMKKGRFVLATNQLNTEMLPAYKILSDYKEQQSVEGGFRFLKDPWFMIDSFFVKTKRRIEALMAVMTLCLLVYNFAQYQIRKNLKDQDESLPNQVGKPIQNPTVKWLFQCMEGIAIIVSETQAMITNLDDLRCKIIRLFGASACQIYGITEKIAGM